MRTVSRVNLTFILISQNVLYDLQFDSQKTFLIFKLNSKLYIRFVGLLHCLLTKFHFIMLAVLKFQYVNFFLSFKLNLKSKL